MLYLLKYAFMLYFSKKCFNAFSQNASTNGVLFSGILRIASYYEREVRGQGRAGQGKAGQENKIFNF